MKKEVKDMQWFKDALLVETRGKGLYPITSGIKNLLEKWPVSEGMCFLFLPHTSASLVINESYDPTARQDLEEFLEKLVPEGQSWYRHTTEGRDDSPSHIRSILTASSLSIPVDDGRLSLGTWQGVYLFEHRAHPHRRAVLIRCLAAS
jgi:secondary thiamine-phosphate synthase enzyme